MSKLEEFLDLVKEYPNLPVVPMVDCDFSWGEYCRCAGEFGSAYLDTIYVDDERIWDITDKEELIEIEADRFCDEHECEMNEQILEIARKNVDGYPWKKVIIVNVDPSNPEEIK